ncbi:DMT family transporter [Dysgonomonas sp. Marseille-P4677]|uniref:DMT family transporter n=1 Tax=Dysgonomonas sp. Marseille-P4677 TaxID=2364790 RepID=UPI0019135594|nr:DMT family transporter [Dysgonomonas sp. Marseille-P4677]MBK5721308.1 DMT family transporter [Dysgonomonas sp. Marseille-P4677]
MSKIKIYLPLMVLGTAFWGISFPISKEAFETVSPYTFMFYRFFIAALALSLIFYKQVLKLDRSTVRKGLISGILLFMGISWQTVGLKYTSSSNASFIAGIEVVLIPLFAFLFMKKAIQPKMWAACILALVGLYTIAMSSGFSNFRVGDLFVFIGSLFYSAYVLYVGKVSTIDTSSESALDARPFVIVQLFTCAVLGGALALVTQGASAIVIPLSIDIWTALLFVGILSTAYMYCIQNIAQKYIEPEKIALTYLCEPIFATVFAYFLLNEGITSKTVIGGSLILLSMFISEVNISRYYKRIRDFILLINIKD